MEVLYHSYAQVLLITSLYCLTITFASPTELEKSAQRGDNITVSLSSPVQGAGMLKSLTLPWGDN